MEKKTMETESKTLEIFLDDLSREAQGEVLAFYAVELPEDLNLDIIPLFVLQTETGEE